MTQLSRTNSQFDRFLFAPLHENGETPLSVLSALTRHDVDAWQEAVRLAQLPKDHAVNSLASTIWKSDRQRWSPLEASLVAARLIELLPSQSESRDSPISTEDNSNKLMMWLVYGIIFWIDRHIREYQPADGPELEPTDPHHRRWAAAVGVEAL